MFLPVYLAGPQTSPYIERDSRRLGHPRRSVGSGRRVQRRSVADPFSELVIAAAREDESAKAIAAESMVVTEAAVKATARKAAVEAAHVPAAHVPAAHVATPT